MSTSYDIVCTDCRESWNPEHGMRRERVMEGLVEMAPQLAALYQSLTTNENFDPDYELSISFQYVDLSFFSKHAGHRLKVIDEYDRARECD